MSLKRIRGGFAVCCGVLAVLIVLLSLQQSQQAVAGDSMVEQNSTTAEAYVFRFDPSMESFEVFTVPTRGGNPQSLGATVDGSVTDVWFTEPGVDQIGRLVYTSTTGEHDWRTYTMSEGSVPFNLVTGEEYVWFTARQGNWIGRLPISGGEVITFPVPTQNSQPTGIDIAPDKSVWFTEWGADQIGQLTVAQDHGSFKEYSINDTDVGAYGITVQDDRYIWFGETGTGAVKRLKVADGSFSVPYKESSYPYELLVSGNYLWLTERGGDKISQIELTTLNIVNSYPITPTSSSRPTGLTLLSGNHFWFSGQGSGQIGRLAYTSPVEYHFEVFDLPIGGLWAMDITADDEGYLWIVAYLPHRIFLPLTMRS